MMGFMRRIVPLCLGLCTAFLIGTPSGHAQSVPLPQNKAQVLDYKSDEIRTRREQQRALKENLAKVDQEIEGLRSSMIKVAREVKKRERDMSALEDQINELQTRRTTLQRKLQKDHREIANMTSGLLRIRDIPPEALIARHGAPLQTAQAAMILRDVMTPVNKHAQDLNADLTELAHLETDLKNRQQTLKEASKRILQDQTRMADLIRRREIAYANLKTDIKTQEEDLAKLAQDAADFKDLIQKLEQRNRDIASTDTPALNEHGLMRHASIPPRLDQKALKSFGDVQMPISGIIRLGFGATNDIGSESQGLKIEGRAGALVVAPINGIVRYKGRFKNYGNMVIIEHGKNYHSLVAGLAKIDTVVGQSISAGEPLGTLGTTRSARPSLYYELRQNGKPVNPARLFADLG